MVPKQKDKFKTLRQIKALSDIIACSELQKGAGSQFDPKVVEAFFAVNAEARTGNVEELP